MIPYLFMHLKLSFILFMIVFVFSRIRIIPNKLQLIILYIAFFKSLFPWGVISLPVFQLVSYSDKSGGFSFDHPAVTAVLQQDSSGPLLFTATFLIMVVWITITLMIFLLALKRFVQIRQKIKKSFTCNDPALLSIAQQLMAGLGLHKSVTIKISNKIDVPLIFWMKEWLIILPYSVFSMDESQKKVILAHEMLHIKRKDLFKFMFLAFIQLIFFFSPFIWFVRHDIINREESVTDQQAMRLFQIPPVIFGETILNFINSTIKKNVHVPLLSGQGKRRLKMRLENLFQNRLSQKAQFIQTCFVAAMLVLACVNCSTSSEDTAGPGKDMLSPVANGRLTMKFGLTRHPKTGKPYNHRGIDLAAPTGTEIIAPVSGKVIMVDNKCMDRRGNYLIINHPNNIQTHYYHLQKSLVEVGDYVSRGQVIATVGNSGVSTGPHVHFEIRIKNKPVDPLTIISIK